MKKDRPSDICDRILGTYLGSLFRHSSVHCKTVIFSGKKKTGREFPLSGDKHRSHSKRLSLSLVHTMTVNHQTLADTTTDKVLSLVRQFYKDHPEIKVSHGMDHVERVFDHACRAVKVHLPPLTPIQGTEIKVAALLHDVDDGKYFPHHDNFENARSILRLCGNDRNNGDGIIISSSSVEIILSMIGWVSCSKNGNHVPEIIRQSGDYHLLIPRWADRLEAVGPIGVVRCYQYNREHNRPLFSKASPRATTEAQVWELASPDRFENYLKDSINAVEDDMISHYYDKLLHVARPPPEIVRNCYLEEAARQSARELVDVCLRFGRTGDVDTAAIEQLAEKLKMQVKY